MKKFITFIKETRFPNKKKLQSGYEALYFREAVIVVLLTLVALICVIIILGKLNNNFIEEVPSKGGTVIEGIIGMPTLVNPILASTEADRDITTLVYSGLLRQTTDGDFIPDLAESYEISTDGTRYTFILKDNIKFHDGKPITAEDVLFTISKIKDPTIKSPRRVQWEGATIDIGENEEIIFTLKKPYASFMDNLTLGIVPSHLWRNVNPTDFNINSLNVNAVGSGPYRIDTVERNSEGIPIKYTLKRFKNFTLGKPYIKEIIIKSYNNEKDLVGALRSGSIDQAGGISPENARTFEDSKSKDIHTMVLPRMFGLFFNSANNQALSDKSVRKAINDIINRDILIDNVLLGYGIPIDSPVPQNMISSTSISQENKTSNSSKESIEKSLESAGWKKNDSGIYMKKFGKENLELGFSITTGDAPELVAAVNEIKRQLEDFGIIVVLRVYETGQLNQIIREREYEALFFGQIINHGSDLYAFWHSSQKKDPGLNIAMFGDEKTDIALNIAETILSREERSLKYLQFEKILKENYSAVFVYSPEYIYITNKKTYLPKNYYLKNSQGRFLDIHSWYKNTDKVWKIFINKNK